MDKDIRILKQENIDLAAASLAKAFMNDPLQTYTFPDEQERRGKSPAHFKAILEFGLKFGEVYTSSNTEGSVVWLCPNETEITPEKAEEGGLTKLPELLGEDAATRFLSALDFIAPYHDQDVPEPHWYVMVVGVHPEHCGKGLGRALLQPVMKKAEEHSTPIYLETAEPSNVVFYKKLGFRVLRELIDPASGLKMWTFRKG